ncbi:quinone oxidoreductase, partial [Rhizobium johnstonii]
MSVKSTMKALLAEAPNSPLRNAYIARPVPGEGQILVLVKASGVNPLDLKIRAGNAAHASPDLFDDAGNIDADNGGKRVAGM